MTGREGEVGVRRSSAEETRQNSAAMAADLSHLFVAAFDSLPATEKWECVSTHSTAVNLARERGRERSRWLAAQSADSSIITKNSK